LGAVIAAVKEKKELLKTRIATLDWGFNTFDALASIGVTPLPRRSGAVQGGMAAYIEEIQKAVEQTVREQVPALKGQYRAQTHAYEDALLAGEDEIQLSVGKIKLSDHLASATARLEKDVERIFSIIGSPADMGAVVLAGGGAHLLTPVLAKNYPELKNIVIPKDPQFAIVDGYLLYGMTRMETSQNG
jgi:chaperonin cofactor prefoldin